MAETQTASEPAAIARAYFEAIGARDTEAMMTFWEPGGIGNIHGVAELRAPDTYREWFGGLFRSFPDFSFEILEIVAEGEKAAVRWRATGTFDGEGRFEGLDPNGARVDLTGFDLLTIRDGRIRHNDAYMNGAEMARQLGALPPAGSAPERALFGALNLKTRLTGLLRRRSG